MGVAERGLGGGRWVLLLGATCPLALLTLFSPNRVHAAVITVGGACNLNAAIAAANADASVGGCPAGSGADRIELTTDLVLTLVDNTTFGASGLPSVTSRITIDGKGFKVSRDLGAPSFRLLHVDREGDLTLTDLVLANGDQRSFMAFGGCVFNGGRLTVEHTTLEDCQVVGTLSANGGGIFNDSSGSTDLRDSVITQCVATADSFAGGGGLFSYGPLTVNSSRFVDNEASAERARGGAVYHFFPELRIDQSSFIDNTASSLTGSSSPTIERKASGGGLDAESEMEVVISNSTFSGNLAITKPTDCASCGPEGAAIRWLVSDLSRITNTTISQNTSCVVDGPTCTASGSTVQALSGGRIEFTTFYGNDSAVTLSGGSLASSLFAASTGLHCAGITDLGGGNLADAATCPTIAGTLTGLDAPLADWGGPTETHRLLSGSNAIDLAGACGLGVDQRGAGRHPVCDSGAYEFLSCGLLEVADLTVMGFGNLSTCHTALLAPALTISPTGDLRVTAGFLINVGNGLVVESLGRLTLGIDASLLP